MPEQSNDQSATEIPNRDLYDLITKSIEAKLPRVDFEGSFRSEAAEAMTYLLTTTSVLRFGRMLLPWQAKFTAPKSMEVDLREFLAVFDYFDRTHRGIGLNHSSYQEKFNQLKKCSSKVQATTIEALENCISHPAGIAWLEIPAFTQLAKFRDTLGVLGVQLENELARARALNEELKRDVRAKAVGDQESRFESAAGSAQRDSQVWLAIAVMTAVALFAYVAFHFHGLGQWTEIVPRVMVASVGYAILYWSFRNYAAAKHNQTVNEHRANSLATMRQFLLTEEAPDTRKEILSQALLGAFGQQPSGFIGGETAPDMSRIINNLQSAPPRGGSPAG